MLGGPYQPPRVTATTATGTGFLVGTAVRNRTERPHLTLGLRDDNGGGLCMDIQTEKSYLAHDRLLSHVALR